MDRRLPVTYDTVCSNMTLSWFTWTYVRMFSRTTVVIPHFCAATRPLDSSRRRRACCDITFHRRQGYINSPTSLTAFRKLQKHLNVLSLMATPFSHYQPFATFRETRICSFNAAVPARSRSEHANASLLRTCRTSTTWAVACVSPFAHILC